MSAKLIYTSQGLLLIRVRMSLFPPSDIQIKGSEIWDLDKLIEEAWRVKGNRDFNKRKKLGRTVAVAHEVIQLPEKVAIMHCKAHRKGETTKKVGNVSADWETKSGRNGGQRGAGPDSKIQTEGKPRYSREDQKLIKDLGGQVGKGGWVRIENKIIVHISLLWAIIMAEQNSLDNQGLVI